MENSIEIRVSSSLTGEVLLSTCGSISWTAVDVKSAIQHEVKDIGSMHVMIGGTLMHGMDDFGSLGISPGETVELTVVFTNELPLGIFSHTAGTHDNHTTHVLTLKPCGYANWLESWYWDNSDSIWSHLGGQQECGHIELRGQVSVQSGMIILSAEEQSDQDGNKRASTEILHFRSLPDGSVMKLGSAPDYDEIFKMSQSSEPA